MFQEIRGNKQIMPDSVGREELNTTLAGEAVIRKLIAGSGVMLSSTGADSGTGDVTIDVTVSGGSIVDYGLSEFATINTVVVDPLTITLTDSDSYIQVLDSLDTDFNSFWLPAVSTNNHIYLLIYKSTNATAICTVYDQSENVIAQLSPGTTCFVSSDGVEWKSHTFTDNVEKRKYFYGSSVYAATLSADFNLNSDQLTTNGSQPIELLNPDGGNYKVLLPTASVYTYPFFIKNTGVSGTLIIRDNSDTVTYLVLSPGQRAVALSDGTDWNVSLFGGITVLESDGVPTVYDVNKIVFSGAYVTDLGGGEVLVTVSGVSGVTVMFSASGSRNLTMTGNITLVDSDEAIQILNPNGSTRLVDLPAPSSSNHAFYIKNTGSNNISVHGESGTLRSIQGLDECLFISNGINWSYIYGYTNFTEEDITFADNTTGDVSTSKHGFIPKLPNDSTKYFNGVGSYVVPDFTTEFGNGSDGDITITGGTVTLTRNMMYNNLTITGTGVLKPAGFIVKVKGTLEIQAGGIIEDNGGNGGNGTSGAPGTGGSAGARAHDGASLPPGGDGGVGGSASASGTSNGTGGSAGAGQVPTPIAPTNLRSGVGGGGGAAHGTTGLNGGGSSAIWASPQQLGGIAGGAATGSGSLRLGGGGGGAGGGNLQIWAYTINNAGEIQAKGGIGGNGVQSGTTFSGNGSGGMGGMIVIYYHSTTGSGLGTLNVGGGAAGTGGNGGGSGPAGLAVSFQI